MASNVVEGTFRQTNLPNQSPQYLEEREELRQAEIELMRQCERVAVLRRSLPDGPETPNYTFEEGPKDLDAGDAPIRNVQLAELFTRPGRALIVYHFMFGKRQADPCPMCTSLLDGLNALMPHLEQNADIVVVAAAAPAELRRHARSRGWTHLRLLSGGDSTFKYDLGSEDREGNQDSTISVFTLGSDGAPRHFYSSHPRLGIYIKERGLDLLNPIWNYLDLTPQGRGDFVTSLDYPAKSRTGGPRKRA